MEIDERLNTVIRQYVETGKKDRNLYAQILQCAASANVDNVRLAAMISTVEMQVSMMRASQPPTSTPDVKPAESSSVSGSGFVSSGSGFVTSAGEYSEQNNNLRSDLTSQFSEITPLKSNGAMSCLFRAVHLGRRKVVIKRIRKEYVNNAKYRDLFYKEFDNAFSLEHQSIVHIYGKGEDDEGPYYYMEYIDGRTLTDVIKIEKRKDENFIIKIFSELYDALSYVHKKQVFHRDLKPDNIMLTFKGDNVKILDFGLAAADGINDCLTVAGTPLYASPEQKKDAVRVDARSDIYSAGIILIEMLTGIPDRKSLTKIDNKTLRMIADRSTMSDPAMRFNSCEEILTLLKKKSEVSGESRSVVPDWLVSKIKEAASDGVISKNEVRMIEIEAENNNVSLDAVKVYMDLEVEKAKERLVALEKQRRSQSVNYQIKTAAIPIPVKKKSNSSRTLLRLVIIILIGVTFFSTIKYISNKKQKFTIESQDSEAFVKGEIVYTVSDLNLRELAAKQSKVLKTCAKNTPVKIISDGYYWVCVEVDGKTGYMAKEYLSHTEN